MPGMKSKFTASRPSKNPHEKVRPLIMPRKSTGEMMLRAEGDQIRQDVCGPWVGPVTFFYDVMDVRFIGVSMEPMTE